MPRSRRASRSRRGAGRSRHRGPGGCRDGDRPQGQEVATLTTQVQDLVATTARLARAMDEVAGFKREAIAVLGHQGEHATRSLDDANRELAILRADLSKKSAELAAMDDLRARLEHDLDNLRQELHGTTRRW